MKVETQDTLKILGVALDRKLTFKAHIKEQLKKADRMLLVWHQDFTLPLPAPLELHDQNAAEKWKKFHLAWTSYSLAMELNKRAEPVQVWREETVHGEMQVQGSQRS